MGGPRQKLYAYYFFRATLQKLHKIFPIIIYPVVLKIPKITFTIPTVYFKTLLLLLLNGLEFDGYNINIVRSITNRYYSKTVFTGPSGKLPFPDRPHYAYARDHNIHNNNNKINRPGMTIVLYCVTNRQDAGYFSWQKHIYTFFFHDDFWKKKKKIM